VTTFNDSIAGAASETFCMIFVVTHLHRFASSKRLLAESAAWLTLGTNKGITDLEVATLNDMLAARADKAFTMEVFVSNAHRSTLDTTMAPSAELRWIFSFVARFT